MTIGTRLRPSVLAARDKLAEVRAKLRAQHDSGSPGVQVCARLTDLLDSVVLDLYRSALHDLGEDLESLIALAPYGGYGRRDVAPYSDVDLMLLHKPRVERRIMPFVRRFTQDIVDAGLELGYSLRTPQYACSLAATDPTIFTSLVEARYLAGSVPLFANFMHRFRRMALRRSAGLIAKIEQARREEKLQHGDSVYLLKPNVKRSEGGLRDLQMVRWIGFARYGEAEPEYLVRVGVLAREEHNGLREAREFLLRLRNEMHFQAGKSRDLLDRNEQVRIAEVFGYRGDPNALPVEQFMRHYIEHTSNVRYAAAHFVEAATAPSGIRKWLAECVSSRMDGDFRIGQTFISANRHALPKVRSSLVEVLRLMDLANRTSTRIEHETWQEIRKAMLGCTEIQLSSQAAARFLSFIDQPGGLGVLLRRLHELRVLERIIPPMAHARHLMQFNEYHKYTVDEHSIRAIDAAASFLNRDDTLGRAYRGIKKKWLLHLALLMHDLGKGFQEDHSEVGRRLAGETAEHLGLNSQDAETLEFLVHKHLLMSHLAQWRDIDDEQVVVQFAVDVGSADILQMLYVLTCADLAAVGPGVLNRWKLDLLARLYRRARASLTGDAALDAEDRKLQEQRAEIRQLVSQHEDQSWWDKQITALPRSYLIDDAPAELVRQLERIHKLPRRSALAWGRHLPDRKAVEYTVAAYEEVAPGIFHKLTGALSSKRHDILSAEIHTLADQLVLDRFYVVDRDFADAPLPSRIQEVCDALVKSLLDPTEAAPSFRRTWSEYVAEKPTAGRLETRVRVDNSTSDQFTILDVFAHDRTGLLYTISRRIFELGLSVHGAKIGTHLDQVVDVFYVTGAKGKIVDEGQINHIRQELLEAIEAFEAAAVV